MPHDLIAAAYPFDSIEHTIVFLVIGGLIGLATPKGAKDRAGHHPVAVALFAVGALTMLGVAGWVLLTA